MKVWRYFWLSVLVHFLLSLFQFVKSFHPSYVSNIVHQIAAVVYISWKLVITRLNSGIFWIFELKKTFQMISNSNQFRGNSTLKFIFWPLRGRLGRLSTTCTIKSYSRSGFNGTEMPPVCLLSPKWLREYAVSRDNAIKQGSVPVEQPPRNARLITFTWACMQKTV